MTSIEIQKGIKISLDELLNGVAKMDISSLEEFSSEINRLIARRKAPNPSERELELIHLIYQPMDKKIQERYNQLSKKNLKRAIGNDEHLELLKLVKIAEEHNVKWLEALVELAQLRSVSLEKVKEQLGMENPSFSI